MGKGPSVLGKGLEKGTGKGKGKDADAGTGNLTWAARLRLEQSGWVCPACGGKTFAEKETCGRCGRHRWHDNAEDHEEGMCGKLLKTMYGTRDAAACWEAFYTDILLRLDFELKLIGI